METEHHLSKRPTWITDSELHSLHIAPDDKTYAVSGTRDLKIVKGEYRFVRGHMCPKDAAERIGEDAAYNTHTVLNAVPQLQWQNNGIWKDLEVLTMKWADKYGQVWVICGPVFFGKSPAMWLGQDGEKKAAIPDALYKIIIRESSDQNRVETLAFVIPNIIPKNERNLGKYLTSISQVEELTGLEFLTALDPKLQINVKSKIAEAIVW